MIPHHAERDDYVEATTIPYRRITVIAVCTFSLRPGLFRPRLQPPLLDLALKHRLLHVRKLRRLGGVAASVG
jgi:hypothetical protein